ncbi:hypothetical protein UlMin_034335 [Ulmus minor]
MDFHHSSLFPTTATILAILLVFYFLKWKPRSGQKPPPKAGGAWPIIGNLPSLVGPEPPHITLGKMADKYGPIFTIRMGVHRTLVISTWETAKECFTTNDVSFANRPKSLASEILGYNYAMLGFSPYGPYWRQVRKIATVEVLSNHCLEKLSHLRQSEVKDAIKKLFELCLKKNKIAVDMKKWFGDITLNVVLMMVVGKGYSEDEQNEGSSDHRKRAIREWFRLFGTFVVGDAIPFLRWLDLGGHEKAMIKTAKELDEVVQEWLEDHKRKRSVLGKEKGGEQDFMDVMISTFNEAENFSSYDVDTITKATSLAVILGGTDTTNVTLIWALSLLLNNPEALNKAQQELDQHVGRERLVKESDIKNLVYLQAVLKETMRLYPAGPLAIPHEAVQDCTVAGYDVEAGTRLLVNIPKLHRDPKVWSEPCEFRPERFLTTHKNVDVRGQNFEYIPFGSGRRICPGISFAQQVAHLTLASLLHGFDITTSLNEEVDMRETIGLSNLKATPLDVLLTPRLPNQAYQ